MTVLDAFDYSWSRPDPQQMAAAGIKVVARYLFSPGKGLEAAEVRALHAAGIGIVLNYEATSGNHLKGAQQGATDGQAARNWAQQLGAPDGLPIYYSCDQQVFESQMPQVMAYLHAADSGPHPSRAYGQYSVCERFGRPAWQTVAWSSGLISKNAALYQYEIEQDFHGSAVDYNRILNLDELGAWWPENSPLGDDMPSADEVAKAIATYEIIGKSTDYPDGVTLAGGIRRILRLSDPAAVAKALKKQLGDVQGLTEAQLETAFKNVLREGTG